MNLEALLADAAEEFPDVTTSSADGRSTWSRRGRAFAAVTARETVAEFGLDPAVAAAAVRTPDTSPSPRGPGWVTFSPAELDEHAADRALAWFGSAYRRAEPRN